MLHPFTSRMDSLVDLPLPQAASSPFETLPYDVLGIIFRLACTDGGRTGCALSLVSRSIRVASRPSRFHSVSILSGISVQLTRFLHALETAKAEARAERAPIPRVRNLCLILTPVFHFMHIKLAELDLAHHHHRVTLIDMLSNEEHTCLQKKVWEEYGRAIRTLFAAVCADVETACLYRQDHHRDFRMARIPCPGGFPRLRELTITRGLSPLIHVTSDAPLFPALWRLHVVQVPGNREMQLQWLAANAPRLSFLRITTSHVYLDNEFRIVPELALALNHNTKHAPVFSELKTLMLMIEPLFLTDDETPQLRAAYAGFAAELCTATYALGVPTTVFNSQYKGQDTKARGYIHIGSLEEGMRRDWLLRVDGGEGLFTPEFWKPRDPVPGPLKRMWTALRARIASGRP